MDDFLLDELLHEQNDFLSCDILAIWQEVAVVLQVFESPRDRFVTGEAVLEQLETLAVAAKGHVLLDSGHDGVPDLGCTEVLRAGRTVCTVAVHILSRTDDNDNPIGT